MIYYIYLRHYICIFGNICRCPSLQPADLGYLRFSTKTRCGVMAAANRIRFFLQVTDSLEIIINYNEIIKRKF